MPTYPGSPQITIDALLKQPELISRALTDLTAKRFIADRIFARGSSAQVQGGAALYQKSESIHLDRDPEEIGVRAEFPRAGWSEAVYTAQVKQHGLEVPITDLTVRRSQQDQIARALRKLANNIVRYVDGKAMTLLTTDSDVQTFAASADWTTTNTDVIADVVKAISKLGEQDEGYEDAPLALIVNWAQWQDLLNDDGIRSALPRETPNSQIQTGQVAPLLGLDSIMVTSRLTAGTVFLLAKGLVGTIADEAPDPAEGYATYDAGDGKPPISTKIYREEPLSQTVIRGVRWPAMFLVEPKSAVKITGA